MAEVINGKNPVQFTSLIPRIRVRLDKLLLAGVLYFFLAATARTETTAFTFQGRLNDNGTPANANYDMQLKLYDKVGVGTGTQIGATIIRPSVKVISGVFTLQLDFTAAAFPGADRFLEVGIKPAGSGAAYTLLGPRHLITSAPYAINSTNAATATHAANATTATTATSATNATNATTATNSTQLNGKPASQYTLTTDSRLTNARPPTAGSANYIQNLFGAPTPAPPASPTPQPNSQFNISGTGQMHDLYIFTTAGIGVDTETKSGGEALYAECLTAGNNCYAVEGYAPTGDYPGYFYGGKGVYVESDDAGKPGLDARSYGASAYAVRGESATYRGGYFKSDSNVIYSLYVDTQDGPTQGTAGLNVRGTIRGEGNLVIGGSKAGYVVDIMQNVDSEALAPGDVVVIVGNSAPVLGQIPVITVKKAAAANDAGLAGIVDEIWSAPDAATKTAYEAEENAVHTAMRVRTTARPEAASKRPKEVDVPLPPRSITDEQGTLHTLPNAASAGPGGYVSVVTLGAFKMVKVDASLGPIQTGDLLTTSTTPGYAMKAAPVVVGGAEIYRTGTILGKALEPLDKGTGVIKVFVTLR
jgi:hypothetical protein